MLTLLFAFFLVAVGIGLLYWGGEILVDNAVALARTIKMSNMMIGLTVVAFGTSCPELAATLTAALKGSPDIAVGNVFGSNVANIGLILAISAIIMPLGVKIGFVRREGVFMLFATALVYPLMIDGEVARWEGVLLFVLLVAFIVRVLKDPGAEQVVSVDEIEDCEDRPVWKASLGVAAGIGLLVGGAQSLIVGATDIALAIGIEERIIGFTVVAFGTSLPELAASIAAARQKHGDIVLGNLVGSNIFNLLCILGITSMVVPIPVPAASMSFDYWAMVVTSTLMLAFLWSRLKMVRAEGVTLLVLYMGYVVFLYFAHP